ncbi:YoaK family protein [Asticcacaulis sp. BYS171W]|uniref:YoaK family protein n=1 Tax=Asticcacaulis aquaticus TaxID=2984212 RepID=A0ABT5HTG4_9CAUL|nr:YoaK family protein [Asticcacaulis aquaticus]MDC7683340.1 YoaK family protein [Asticcacaulis aquaticus]
MRRTLRQISGRRRTETGDARLGLSLAFVAGAINAGGFLAVGVYTSHMSGMVASFADFSILNHWGAAFLAATYVLCFFLGAVTSSLLVNAARQRRLHSEFALTLGLEALLLLVFGFLAAGLVGNVALSLPLTIGLLCYLMGLQNSLMTKLSHAEIRTTHMTGVITDLGIEAGRYLFGRLAGASVRFHPKKARLLGGLLLAFTLGGLIGAFGFSHMGFVTVLPFSLLLGVIAMVPILDDLSRQKRRTTS